MGIPDSVSPFARCIPSELFGSIGLSAVELARVQQLIFVPRAVKKGQSLFQSGQPFKELFAVRAGSFKSGVLSRSGDLRVTGFHLPGDMLGFDGIAQQRHNFEVKALEHSEVCAMPFEHVAVLARELQPVQRLFMQMMGQQIVCDSAILMILGSLSAEERVAAFLVNLLERLKARGFSGSELTLPMQRQDVASYLGLKTETVSRAFAALVDMDLIHVSNRTVRVLDFEALEVLTHAAKH